MPGSVYEKRLIEAYIAENHKDPVNGEELEITDLIDLKSSRIVAPRPPTLTSIPSLLSTFQNEWDALALESFNLRQQLQQTRQELATALYQHDAAVRVIARLTRERDEARDALSKVTIGAGGVSNGDAMQIDSQGLPDDLAAKVDATQEKYEANLHSKEIRILSVHRLSKSRRKRPVPKEWADAELIEKFGVATTSKALYPGAKSLAVDDAGQLVVFGGSDGVAGVFSIPENKVVESFKAGGAVTDAVWYGSQPVVSTASGAVKVFGDSELSFTSHAGSANGLALHPSGDILASVGIDKSFVFYDLPGGKAVTQVYTDSGKASHEICFNNTKKQQNSRLLHSIRMGIYLLLEALMGKSSCSILRRAKMRRTSILEALCRISPSQKMASGLQRSQKAPTVLLSSTYERRARLRKLRFSKSVDKWTASDGTTLASIWQPRAPEASPSHNIPRRRSRGQTSLALLFRPPPLLGDQRPRP